MSKKLVPAPCVLVCVTPQQSCARLIEAGARIAKEGNRTLIVLSVFAQKDGMNANTAALENLYETARSVNAQMSVYFNDNPDIVTAVVAKRENAQTLVTGFPRENSSQFIARIHELVPDLPITMVDDDANEYRILPSAIRNIPMPMSVK